MASETPPPSSASDSSTLTGFLKKISTPLHPRLLAYLLGLLFCCVLGYYEVQRVDLYTVEIPRQAPDSKISMDRRAYIPDPDGIRWVIYTQMSCDESSWRLPHWSNEDNYPDGRFVGWSSPPMWWLKGLGYVRHWFSGESLKASVAEVAPHYNTFIWMFAGATMGLMFIMAYGWRGALIIPALFSTLLISKYGIYSPDHHLWILLSALGTLACVSAPFYRQRTRRAERVWFAGAAAFCAFGFWISAPSQAIVVFGIAVGMLFVPAEAAKKVNSSNWRLFGELTALLSLAAYWWEFGSLLPMHVELNNPVYAAAGLVSGIWLWQLHDFAASGRRWDSLCPRPLVYSLLGFAIIVIPLIVYLPYCFSLADPYFARWEAQIAEEQPLDILAFVTAKGFLFSALIAAVTSLALRLRRAGSGLAALMVLILAMILVWGYFGLSSNRFSETVLGCICFIVALGLPCCRRDLAGWFNMAFASLVCFSAIHTSIRFAHTAELYGLPGQLASCKNMIILSNNILKFWDSPDGGVLSPSNEASLINFYTELPVYGTAYWENKDGLQYTYRVLFDERPAGQQAWTSVRRMLRHGKVRVIAIPLEFGYQSSYMLYGKDRIIDPSFTFAYHLIHTKPEELEPWLKLEKGDDHYRIFRVIEDAPDFAPESETQSPEDETEVQEQDEDANSGT